MKKTLLTLLSVTCFWAVSGKAAVLTGPITNSINSHAYYLTTSQSWSNCEAEASSLGGHLVTINDAAEQDFVYTNFANYGGFPRDLWTGFRRSATNYFVFVWANNEPVTYTHWAAGEPSNCGGTETKAMIYAPSSPAAGLWNDATDLGRSGCDDGDLAPLGVVEVVLPEPPPSILAGPLVNPSTFHVYYLLSSTTWSNSEAAAITLGGHLVSISDAPEQSFVYSNFANFGGIPRNLWIGMRRSGGTFIWASGEPVTFTQWASGEPNNCGTIETKGIMYGPALPAAGSWNDVTEAGRSGCNNVDLSPYAVVEADPLKLGIAFGSVNLCWNSISNHNYQVEYTSAATTNQWLPLGAPILAVGTNTCTSDAISNPTRFYRVLQKD